MVSFKKSQVKLTTLNGAEILSLGQWEACRALREAFATAESWSGREDGGGAAGGLGARGSPNTRGSVGRRGRRCAVIFLDEADALLAR